MASARKKLDHNQERRRCRRSRSKNRKLCSWKKTDEKKIEKFRDEYELFNSLKNFSKADEYLEAKHNQ